jgi:hypothetical protein
VLLYLSRIWYWRPFVMSHFEQAAVSLLATPHHCRGSPTRPLLYMMMLLHLYYCFCERAAWSCHHREAAKICPHASVSPLDQLAAVLFCYSHVTRHTPSLPHPLVVIKPHENLPLEKSCPSPLSSPRATEPYTFHPHTSRTPRPPSDKHRLHR